jgi:hypothetical protein
VSEALAAAAQWLWQSGLLWLLLIPLLPLAAFGGLQLAESFGLWNLPIVERSYGMLMRWAGWLGVSGRGRTPYERLDALRRRAPDAGPTAQRITELYVKKRFGRPQRAGNDDALRSELRMAWTDLRKKLMRAVVRRDRG